MQPAAETRDARPDVAALIAALGRRLGKPQRGDGGDPFDGLLNLTRGRGDPLVVWNLGGAADAEHWPRAVQNALAVLRGADGPLAHAGWPTTPIVYIVSDSATEVLRGLQHRLQGDTKEMAGEFGHWSGRFRIDGSRWRQYGFPDATDPCWTTPRATGPRRNRTASPSTFATVVGGALRDGPPLLIVYLHVDHELAWRHLLLPTGAPIDILVSTCRGTSYRSLEPSAGEEATLWRELMRAPRRPLPRVWCCDPEIFRPPRDWISMRAGGGYGDPGVALPPPPSASSRPDDP